MSSVKMRLMDGESFSSDRKIRRGVMSPVTLYEADVESFRNAFVTLAPVEVSIGICGGPRLRVCGGDGKAVNVGSSGIDSNNRDSG